MARPAPTAERIVAILNFLAAHPEEAFSLSELARRLDLNKATAHAVLSALTNAGYILRHPLEKTYTLGPALITLGDAANKSYQPINCARDVMVELSAELDVDCVAKTVIDNEIVILSHIGTRRPLGIAVHPGYRIPLVPPLGTVFVAWSADREIEQWIQQVGPTVAAADRRRFLHAVKAVRARGYSVGVEGAELQRVLRVLAEHDAGGEIDEAALQEQVRQLRDEEYALVELDSWSTYQLVHITAPVFGAQGEVTLAMSLIGFHEHIPANQIPKYADRLVEACDRVTRAIGGRSPEELADVAAR